MGFIRFVLGLVAFFIAIKIVAFLLAIIGFALKLLWIAVVLGVIVLVAWVIYRLVSPEPHNKLKTKNQRGEHRRLLPQVFSLDVVSFFFAALQPSPPSGYCDFLKSLILSQSVLPSVGPCDTLPV
jgi:hypothetical protein